MCAYTEEYENVYACLVKMVSCFVFVLVCPKFSLSKQFGFFLSLSLFGIRHFACDWAGHADND